MKGSSFRRKIINARRVFISGLHSFVRNAWLSTAATFVMVITLSSILLTIFASVASTNTIKSFTDNIDISIFFKDEVTKEQIDELSEDLRKDSTLQVKEIHYISKEEAQKIFESAHEHDLSMRQAISQVDGSMPASIRVKTVETDALQEVVKVARHKKYAEWVESDSYKDEDKRAGVERLGSIAQFLRSAGFAASIIFGILSMLIVFNTIRMTIFNRRDEISIMQLIGASKWYIRGPFLVEASIYGLIAGGLSVAFFFMAVLGQSPKLGGFVEEINPTVQQFLEISWVIIPATILAGVSIGAFSAYLAIRKHLKIRSTK